MPYVELLLFFSSSPKSDKSASKEEAPFPALDQSTDGNVCSPRARVRAWCRGLCGLAIHACDCHVIFIVILVVERLHEYGGMVLVVEVFSCNADDLA